MTRKEEAARIVAESMCNKPDYLDLPTHIARELDRAGMLSAAPAGRGRYTVEQGRRGPKIVYNAA